MKTPCDIQAVLKNISSSILVLILLIIVLPSFFNHSYSGSNEQYLDHLASIVLQYQKRHTETPEYFEIALHESKVVLPNRGDKDGRPLFYRKIDNKTFFLRAIGKNLEDDLGLKDDLDTYYINMEKVDRDKFIQYIEQLDDVIRSQVYLEFFEPKSHNL